MHRLSEGTTPPQSADQHEAILTALARLERKLDRFERLFSDAIGAYLNARFPYGDGKTDRWRRRR